MYRCIDVDEERRGRGGGFVVVWKGEDVIELEGKLYGLILFVCFGHLTC